MTGGQFHPGTGKTLQGKKVKPIQLVKICQAIGVERIKVVDPYLIKETQKMIKTEMEIETLSVIITNRPCTLYPPEKRKQILETPFQVNHDQCIGCHSCIKVSCPAIYETDEKTTKGLTKTQIDFAICTGCSVCAQVCPVQAISQFIKETPS